MSICMRKREGVYVCVCVRESERGIQRETKTERLLHPPYHLYTTPTPTPLPGGPNRIALYKGGLLEILAELSELGGNKKALLATCLAS